MQNGVSSAIATADRSGLLELSFAQQRLWFLAQLEGVSQAYHIPVGLRLTGDLDHSALRRALDSLIARHEALRTTFAVVNGEPTQRIGAIAPFALEEYDFRDRVDAAIALESLAEEEASRAFDFEAGPLIRGRLVAMSASEHVLLVTMHHIVSDGWSMAVLVQELSALYAAYRDGRADPLPALTIQYADYANWQRRWLTGDVLQEQVTYWQETLRGAPAVLELPLDHARPSQQDHSGAVVSLELDADLTKSLKLLSQRHGTTLFMTLLSAWGVVLGRLSGQDDVVIGTPVAIRTRSEVEGLIGFFVNTLAMRLDMSNNPTVSDMLTRVKTRVLQAQEYQELPFEHVVEVAKPPRSLAHSPLFQVMFAWQNTERGELALSGLELAPIGIPYAAAKYDLTLNLSEAGDQIVGGLEYATALFDRSTIERHIGYLRTTLLAMVADDRQAVGQLPFLSEQERHQVLVEWNATDAPYPADRCIHELFEEQVAKAPDAVAVIYEDTQLTYEELNSQANRLAHYLRRLGVKPDTRVALCVERSLEMMVGLLAVLKAGDAYVPLDPLYPSERLAYMLEDSSPVVVLTHAAVSESVQSLLREQSAGATILDLQADAKRWGSQPSENLDRADLTSSHLSYVIYTSGSTGQPKGVMVEHRKVERLFTVLSRRSISIKRMCGLYFIRSRLISLYGRYGSAYSWRSFGRYIESHKPLSRRVLRACMSLRYNDS